MVIDSRVPAVCRCARALALAAGLCIAHAASAQTYVNQVLTDNICCETPHTDPRLATVWGVTFDPAGLAWMSANATRRAVLLDGLGTPQGLSPRMAVRPLFNGGAATGVVFSPGQNFLVSDSFGGMGPARFIFATQEGSILGWTQRPAPLEQSTIATFAVDNIDSGAAYTGVALAHTAAGDRLYVANIHQGRIDAFDGAFAAVTASFTDPNLPAGFAPFNIRVLGGHIYISFAVRDASQIDALVAPGNGIIDRFTLDGSFESRLVTGGPLNAPWGMALAPANFGALSNTLLVSNFGDGRINAFDPATGAPLGTLNEATGAPMFIDGIRGIEFGNGLPNQPTNTLFYGTGPTFGIFGQFGRIDLAACYPNCDNSTVAPALNIGDFSCFLNRLAAGDSYANCDGSTTPPVLNIADFSCFLNAFAAGCS
jgi:uncharacterized protein (TIGR03118 family)